MMRRRFLFTCLLLLGAAAAQAQPAALAVLTSADAPLRLIRGATVYKAANGVALQKDDILESGPSGAQVELGPQAIVALGPQTRVLLASLPADGRGSLDLALLGGWLKVLDQDGRATVVTPALQVGLAKGSTIVHAGAQVGQDAVFAEDGEQQLTRLDTSEPRGKTLKLAAEQYAALEPGKPLAAGRPPRAFIAAMPPGFRDRLARAPDLPRAGKVAPIKEREADFADVEAWLQAALPVHKTIVARVKPRLADPAFRKALDGALGQSADWKPVLHPARTNHQETPS